MCIIKLATEKMAKTSIFYEFYYGAYSKLYKYFYSDQMLDNIPEVNVYEKSFQQWR